MIRKRYIDEKKIIVDANKLKLTDSTLVQIYQEDKWYNEVYFDLEESTSKFERLKPYIMFIAKNICNMDIIVQKYFALHRNTRFADNYEVAYIYLNNPAGIRLTYYGIHENTQFDVLFEYINNEFILKSCGMVKNIPSDWEKQ